MKRIDKASTTQTELLARIVECSNDAIFSVDEGRITTWNRGAERLYGYTAQEAVGQMFISLLWPTAIADEATELYARLYAGENGIAVETDLFRKDGMQIPVCLNFSLLTDASGAAMGAAITARGISEEDPAPELWDDMAEVEAFAQRAAWLEEGLENLSHKLTQLEVIDRNTGLKNRRTLDTNLDKECQRAARYCMPLSFLMLSIDNLKADKEAAGIQSSEALRKRVALLLYEEARNTDMVACYEEELFGIVLPHTDREGAMVAAERIRERIAAAYDSKHPVTVSIGVATFSHAMESHKELIAEAEQALLLAKQAGRNRAVHYEATQEFALFETGRAKAKTNGSTSRESSGQAIIRVGDAASLQISRQELAHAYDSTIEGWARILDIRNHETEGHSRRVTEMAVCLAQLMGIQGQDLVYIRWGALLHDIGKIGVPDSILLKPGPLTPAEWVVMRSHTTLADEVLGSIAFLQPALDIPLSHHERWDATGYPQGLMGEEIPLAARIFAPVDVWDALRSDRPYRKAWSERDALDYIYSLSGKHFDPKVMRAFFKMMLANNIGNESDPLFLAA